MIREGIAEVPGASLRYRVAGKPGRLPAIVLENGWGGSYDYFAPLQAALAPHAQLLLYNRAGIGGSVAHEPVTVEGMSRQLSALIDVLDIRTPVVIAGQSYGGLVCGVHAAQIPGRLRAVVQIDATPECAEPQVDATLGTVRGLGKFMALLATLRIPEPFFVPSMKELSEEDRANLRRYAFGNAASLRGALAEMDLLPQIREACSKGSPTPRLVISAGRSETITGLMSKLVKPEKAAALIGLMQAQHKAMTERGARGSQWVALPHTHGGLVTTRAGAADTAACMIDYLGKLPVTAA